MNTMRRLLAPVLLVLALSGCGDDGGGGEEGDQSVTLEMTVSDWNGWDENYTPQPETTTVELTVGEDFVVDSIMGEVGFEVTAVDSDTIEFSSSEAMSPVSPSGGIDLLDPKDHFSMDRDGTLELATPTMDAGTNVTFKEVERPAGGGGGEEGDQSVTLEVTVSDRNGWDENYTPQPETTTVELTVGEDFTVPTVTGSVDFAVTAINADAITLTASDTMANLGPSGGLDVPDPVDEFEVPRGGTLQLATPTFDPWTSITLNEVERPAA